MRLIRNTTKDGRCKYALVRLDKIRNLPVGTEMEKCITRALEKILELHDEIQDAHQEMTAAFGEFQRKYKTASQKLNLASSKLSSLAAIARDAAKGD
jgi:hypothetical protein